MSLFAGYDPRPLNDRTNGSSGRSADTKTVKVNWEDRFDRAVQQTVSTINVRFGPVDKTTDTKYHAANALILSRTLDLMVEAGMLKPERRYDAMRDLYRGIGKL